MKTDLMPSVRLRAESEEPLRVFNPDARVAESKTDATRPVRVAIWLALHSALSETTKADRERAVRSLVTKLVDSFGDWEALRADLCAADLELCDE